MENHKIVFRLLVITIKKCKTFNLATFFLLLLVSSTGFAQTRAQKSKIIKETNVSRLGELQKEYANKAKNEKAIAIEAAEKNGWETIMELPDNGFAELQKITKNGTPIYYNTFNNTDAVISTRTNHINSNGSLGLSLDGQNMIAHVWDGGTARTTHQEFTNPDGSSRIRIQDTDPNTPIYGAGHAGHVTGIIAAAGVDPDARGMAPKALINAYEWNNDLAEVAAAAADGMLISNHSYGFSGFRLDDLFFGGYTEGSKSWDEILYNAPYFLMIVSAGNEGNTDTYNDDPLEGNASYDKLTDKAVCKNNLTVASAEDAIIDDNGNLVSVEINSFSSEGPTDDYRIKPDIVGNGDLLYSPVGLTDNHYDFKSGTSMSAPNVAGSLLLLQQHYENLNDNFMKAATLKGIALHTADDFGSSGPDAISGWGLLNAKFAAETISNVNNGSIIEELTLTSGESYSITVDSDEVNLLKASITWTDPTGTVQTIVNDNTPILVNDLDITVSKGSTSYKPYRLSSLTTNETGDNTVDPFERVDVTNASGTYTITVTHKGSLSAGTQDFSLIVTGLKNTQAVCLDTVPTGVNSHDVKDVSALISWSPLSATTYVLRYRETGTTNWTTKIVSGYSTTISELLPMTSYEVQVGSVCIDTNSALSSSHIFETKEMIYCKALGYPDRTVIGNVTLKDINNTSSNYNGYFDFSHISTDLMKGDINTIVISKERFVTYDFSFAVYIDYNQNGSFEDDGELVWSRLGSNFITRVRGNFIVPDSATNGATKMRVIMSFGFLPAPCETFFAGDVEDYTVVISNSFNECESAISSIPYNEGFENTIGEWKQGVNNDIDWVINTNETPSNGTGPIVSSEGNHYLYVEATGNSNSQAILTSPCIDLSSFNQALFSFDYHNYGDTTDVGMFDLEVSTDDGINWTSIWSQQGNNDDLWITQTINLEAYLGENIRLRFNRITGTASSADIAIDNISLGSDLLSVDDNELKGNVFSIFPVPSTGILNIVSKEIGNQPYVIYNMLGQEVMSGILTNTVNIEKLVTGSYVIKVGDNVNYIKQFVKM